MIYVIEYVCMSADARLYLFILVSVKVPFANASSYVCKLHKGDYDEIIVNIG